MIEHDPVRERARDALAAFRATGEIQFLHEARDVLDRALCDSADNAPHRPGWFDDRGRVLLDLSMATNCIETLDQAVESARTAVASAPPVHPEKVFYLNNFAQALADRYDATGLASDLDEADRAYRAALDLAPTEAILLGGLSTVVRTRYDLHGNPASLDEAVRLCRGAVRYCTDPLQKLMILYQLSSALFVKFKITSDRKLLDEAAVLAWEAARDPRARAGHRIRYLVNLGTVQGELAGRAGDVRAFEDAVGAYSEALTLAPPGHGLRPVVQHGLSNVLFDQYRITGDPRVLDEAIGLLSCVLDSAHETTTDYGGHLVGLANALLTRYRETGSPAALATAVDLLSRALDVLPATDSFRPMVRSLLGGSLLDQAAQQVRVDEAASMRAAGLEHLRAAVAEIAPQHTMMGIVVNNLLVGLQELFSVTHDAELIAEAHRICLPYLARFAPGQTEFDLLANTFTMITFSRVDLGAPSAELDLPERLLRQVLATSERRDAGRALFVGNLSVLLERRLKADPGAQHLREEMLDLRRTVVRTTSAPTGQRVRFAESLGRFAAESGDWARAVADYSTAIDLMTLMSPRSWARADREGGLRGFFALASDAAACALNAGAPQRALELLEQGRGVVLDYPALERSGVDRLRQVAPDLANSYQAITSDLEQLAGNASTDARQTAADSEARHQLHVRWTDVLTEIRSLGAEFADFMRPPPFERLTAALDGRTVAILNVSRYRCDALVVSSGGLSVVPLKLVNADVVRQQVVRFLSAQAIAQEPAAFDAEDRRIAPDVARSVLSWLWTSTVFPVLSQADVRRIWWCPTGLLSFLPMHAAGSYFASAPKESTLDRVVSSYTPTIRSLLECIARVPATAPERPGVLAVGVTETPGEARLGKAASEAAAVHETVGAGSLLVDGDAQRSHILDQLRRHSWFHFAGHGRQTVTEPMAACVLPYDHDSEGPLTGPEIAVLGLRSAQLAFLSACETASGRLDLADEPVHLAGAFQQAGFAQVVATRWSIPDRVATRFTQHFYQELLRAPGSAVNAAEVLHRVQRAHREDNRYGEKSIFLWPAYIHMGL